MGFFDKAKELGEAALEKGKDLAQITKLNIDITTLESKISDAKKNIGNIVVSKKIKIENEDIKNEIKNIDQYLDEIEKKKVEISAIENKGNNNTTTDNVANT